MKRLLDVTQCSVFKVSQTARSHDLQCGCQMRAGAKEDEVQKAPCENIPRVLDWLSLLDMY